MHISSRMMDQADIHVIKEDYQAAARLMSRAAKLGNLVAYHNLAHLYLHKKDHFPNRTKAAIALLTHSAERGFMESQRVLGRMYHQGQGVKKDLSKARYWYLKAAEQNDLKSAVAALSIKNDKNLFERVETLFRMQFSSPLKTTSH